MEKILERKVVNENKGSANPNGSFTVVKEGASYSLPTFKIVEDKELVAEDTNIRIDFVRSTKAKQAMAILELTDIGKGPIWKYKDPDGTEQFFPLDHPELKKIEAKVLETEGDPESEVIFQLQIFDGEKNAGINLNSTGILTEEDKVLDSNTPLTGDDIPGFYVAAMDVKQTVIGQSGTTTQCLLNMLIFDLKAKSQELPSRETSIAITKLEEAQLWLAKRIMDRKHREVLNTNEK